jgi:regulator of RNase E activity RraA
MQHLLGVRRTFIQGPVAQAPGAKAVGPAVTLQFMPQREDVASGLAQEEIEKRSALWAVMEEIQSGDVLVVQAYGDPHTGCLGEMLLTYLRGRGCAGVVVDGCIRDSPRAGELGLPVWSRGSTPNYASQGRLYPWAYNVPIACSDVLVLPGDIVVADDDGAVCVPQNLASIVAEKAAAHEDWEQFSRVKLADGGALQRYYPLNEKGRREYEAWLRQQGR